MSIAGELRKVVDAVIFPWRGPKLMRRNINNINQLQTELRHSQDEIKSLRGEIRQVQFERNQAEGRIAGDVAALGHQLTHLWKDVHRRRLFLSLNQEGLFVLMEGELISEAATRERQWDPHIVWVATRAAETALARNGGRFVGQAVDVGAHMGLISVPLARCFDRVTSFEPNEFNVVFLRANVALNGLVGRVDVRQTAVYSQKTRVSLAPGAQQEIPLPLDHDGRFDASAVANSGAYQFSEHGSGLSETEAVTLDSLGFVDLAFLKVDAQGADGEVLMGAWDTIRSCRPWIVFEWETR